jgi:multiple sugar transport system permease protein/putative aldouronate transport system permease protein
MVMKWSHLTNNFLVYILPNLTNAYNIILFKTFIEQLPPSLDESAQIDGARDMTVLFRIVAPLCTPIIATIALFNAVWHWNSWYDNYIYTSSREGLMTLQYLLVRMLRESEAMRQIAQRGSASALRMSPESLRMATATVIIVPIFCAYPFVQRYFVKGIMVGAVKG